MVFNLDFLSIGKKVVLLVLIMTFRGGNPQVYVKK